MKKNIKIKKALSRIAIGMLLLLSVHGHANNLQISSPTFVPVNDISNSIYIQFNISWENSFRLGAGTKNWDAAWLFVKYRVAIASGGDGIWRHVKLNSNSKAYLFTGLFQAQEILTSRD